MKPVVEKKSFSMVELVTVMAVIAVVLNIVVPNLTGMHHEGTKVEETRSAPPRQ